MLTVFLALCWLSSFLDYSAADPVLRYLGSDNDQRKYNKHHHHNHKTLPHTSDLNSDTLWETKTDNPLSKGRYAILQTGLESTWLWKSTFDSVVVPNRIDGWQCHWFLLLHRPEKDPVRWNKAVDPALRGDYKPELFNLSKSVTILKTKLARSDAGEVIDAQVLSSLEMPEGTKNKDWNTFQVVTVGAPENLIMAFQLLKRGMDLVMSSPWKYEWVFRLREDAGWWAPSYLNAMSNLPQELTDQGPHGLGTMLFRPCKAYGLSDKAWVSRPRASLLLAHALYEHILMRANEGQLFLATKAQYAKLNMTYMFFPKKLRGQEHIKLPLRKMLNTEHFYEQILAMEQIPYAQPAATFRENGLMASFGLTVSDSRVFNRRLNSVPCFSSGVYQTAEMLSQPPELAEDGFSVLHAGSCDESLPKKVLLEGICKMGFCEDVSLHVDLCS